MIPLVLTNSSPGAPALTGQDGSLYNILKWALPELGWTLEFDDSANFRAAFRTGMPAGSGYFLRIRDKGADHGWGDGRYMAVEGFSSMSDVDTGNDGFPSSDHYLFKATETDATVHPWAIIGTATFFWFLPNVNGIGHRWYWAGDYIAFASDDATNFCIGAEGSPTTSTTATVVAFSRLGAGADGSQVSQCAAMSRDGLAFGVNQGVVSPIGSSATSGEMGSIGTYPDPFTGSVNVSRIELADSLENWARRGVLPGILNPMADLRVSSQSDFANQDIVAGLSNGRIITDLQYFALNRSFDFNNSGWRAAAFFDVSNDWGPDW